MSTDAQSLRVLVADDHEFFRQGLRELLEEQGIDVVGEASDGSGAVDAAKRLSPDVVVMDLNMPGMSGIEATRQLTEALPGVGVLILTISGDDQDVIDAVLAGACGYLVKDASVSEIVRAIAATAEGDSVLSPRIASRVLHRLRSQEAEREPPSELESLSERELEVLRLVAAGKENAAIAADLFISPRTVKNHLSSIFEKLGVENRVQAALIAARAGLV